MGSMAAVSFISRLKMYTVKVTPKKITEMMARTFKIFRNTRIIAS